MDLTPGVLLQGGAGTGPPIAVVTQSPERAAAYLRAAPIGWYVVVHELAHLPAGVVFGGVALLDGEELPEGLPEGLLKACGLTDDSL